MTSPSHIILIGFKHTGKSTVGQLLADTLNYAFHDLDKYIESNFQTTHGHAYTCREIMQIHGADFFRTLETNALKTLLAQNPDQAHLPSIIALGGGTPMQPENQSLIALHRIIHLTAHPDAVFKRIMQHGHPAFFPIDIDPRVTFNQLWEEREQVYRQLTDICVHNDHAPQNAVDSIHHLLMPPILLIHGPNLNMLGKRDPTHYGSLTLADIEKLTRTTAHTHGFQLKTYQSNHEGALIDILQTNTHNTAGIIINPGAFTHYSYALYDALLDTRLPIVEVHLSEIKQRETWRSISVTAPACIEVIWGKKEKGYIEAVEILARHLTT